MLTQEEKQARNRANVVRWRAANPTKRAASDARRLAANPASVRAGRTRWRAANLASAKASVDLWKIANPARVRAINARRRASKRAATVPLNVFQQAEIIAIYAKARALTELTGFPYHVDHKKPLSKGGLHHPDNLQVLTATANLRKGSMVY